MVIDPKINLMFKLSEVEASEALCLSLKCNGCVLPINTCFCDGWFARMIKHIALEQKVTSSIPACCEFVQVLKVGSVMGAVGLNRLASFSMAGG